MTPEQQVARDIARLDRDIPHQVGDYWVGSTRKPASYTVYRNTLTHAVPIASFAMDDDGLSLAIAYCNYRHKKNPNPNN